MSMNNEQKNTYVKRQMTAALLRLLKEKNLADISVSELTSAAKVGRVSFYRKIDSLKNGVNYMNRTPNRNRKRYSRHYLIFIGHTKTFT